MGLWGARWGLWGLWGALAYSAGKNGAGQKYKKCSKIKCLTSQEGVAAGAFFFSFAKNDEHVGKSYQKCAKVSKRVQKVIKSAQKLLKVSKSYQ